MVLSIFLAVILFISGVYTTCPILKDSYKGLNLINASIYDLSLYQYKSVDPMIQSPFHYSEGATRAMTFKTIADSKLISSSCYYRVISTDKENEDAEGLSFYKSVKIVEQNSSKFNLEYETDLLFCDQENKMSEIYVIDFEDQFAYIFLSLYGCEMFVVDGDLTKFEGVLIFTSHWMKEYILLNIQDKLNFTYNFLQNEANISMNSITTVENPTYQYVLPNSCDDILNSKMLCEKAMENKFLKESTNYDIFYVLLIVVGVAIFVILIKSMK